MIAAPRVLVFFVARLSRQVRVTQHPEILPPVYSIAGQWVGVGELGDMPMAPKIVHGMQRISMLARRGEIAQPIIRPYCRPMAHTFQAVIARGGPGGEQLLGRLE